MEETAALATLMRESMAGLGPGFYSPAETAAAERALTVPDETLIRDETQLVAEVDGVLAGTGGWSRRRKRFTGTPAEEALAGELLDPATEPARIRAFFVSPQFARRGIGRALCEACASAARAAGFRRLVLVATLPGVPLYRALGFEDLREEILELPDGAGGVVGLRCVEMGRVV
jgi:ribosomal protein S18 acetylase RimI-like enzyme